MKCEIKTALFISVFVAEAELMKQQKLVDFCINGCLQVLHSSSIVKSHVTV